MDPSSAESAINALEVEENEMNTIKPADDKRGDTHGSTLERTFQNIKNGAQVEPSEKGTNNDGLKTGEDSIATANGVKI